MSSPRLSFKEVREATIGHLQIVAGIASVFLCYGYASNSEFFRIASLGILGIVLVYIGVTLKQIKGSKSPSSLKGSSLSLLAYPFGMCALLTLLVYSNVSQKQDGDAGIEKWGILQKRVHDLELRLMAASGGGVGEEKETQQRAEIPKLRSSSIPGVSDVVTPSTGKQSPRDGKSLYPLNGGHESPPCIFKPGTDFQGNDLLSSAVNVQSNNECCQKCLADPRCEGFTLVVATKQCWLKHGVQQERRNQGTVSGLISRS